MKIPVQANTIETTKSDPFKNDLLDRETIAQALTNLVFGIEGPAVIGVDGEWGSGKTTFLQMWHQLLESQDLHVIRFNAWETDFTSDPLVALSSELASGLRQYISDEELSNILDLVAKLIKANIPNLVRFATGGMLDVSPLLEENTGDSLATFSSEDFTAYERGKTSIEEFKSALSEVVLRLPSKGKSPPLVIMIDELDRCRPNYAVELLEVTKHLFSVQGVIFVLGVNTDQLAHSVCALYGSSFNSRDYLRRFINIDVRLPPADSSLLVESTLDSLGIDSKASLTPLSTVPYFQSNILEVCSSFFDTAQLDYRTIDQTLRRISLVNSALLKSAPKEPIEWVRTLHLVMQILRTIDINLYRRFCTSQSSDEDVIYQVFSIQDGSKLLQTASGQIFASTIIVGAWDLIGRPSKLEEYANVYRRLHTRKSGTRIMDSPDTEQRKKHILFDFLDPYQTIQFINGMQSYIVNSDFGLKSVVELIELFEPSHESGS